MILIDLIYNLALLAALSVISVFILERMKDRISGKILQGLLFGFIAIIAMLRPINMGPGLIFDGRSVVISLCGFFFGPFSVIISWGMAVSLRIYQGGAGAGMGILVISSSSLLGLIFYYKYIRRSIEITSVNLLGFGILVHLAMLFMCIALPSDIAYKTFKEIAVPVMLVYPPATVLIGKIIYDSISRNRFIEALTKSESDLRRSESYLRTLFQTIPDLIWLKDKNGIYLSCNRMFERFFGAAESDILGKTDYDFIDKGIGDFFRDNDMKAIASGKPNSNEEWITFADDGHRALLDTIKTPMFDNSGVLIGVLGIGHDITRLKQAEEKIITVNEELKAAMEEMEAANEELIATSEVLQANEKELQLALEERKLSEEKVKNLLAEKELLLKEVHHRIKNNMNTIKGLLTLQIMAGKDSSAIVPLKDAESRVQSMITLYDRLYCTENYRELPVKDYLERLVEEIISSFPNREIVEIKTEIEDFILNVQTLSPLGIIVNEILTNIMKHAFTGRESGLITLTASLQDNHPKIVIADNGVGIPESISFKNSKGFGMQLIGMLTEQIGGSIIIERGEGTKFVMEFDV